MPAPELAISAFLCTLLFALGSIWFGRFELETPRWRRTLKLVLFLAIAVALTARFGLAAGVGFLSFALLAGLSVHFVWCRRHGIDPWSAEPWDQYRRLRGWSA